MSKSINILDKDYIQWIKELSSRYRRSQIKAAVKVNEEMLRFYWELGMAQSMSKNYPSAPFLFKDRVYLDMLGLPLEYKESKLRKEIVSHSAKFGGVLPIYQ